MNLNKLNILLLIFFLTACQQFDSDKKTINYSTYLKYSNTGFTLIYNDELKESKIEL